MIVFTIQEKPFSKTTLSLVKRVVEKENLIYNR